MTLCASIVPSFTIDTEQATSYLRNPVLLSSMEDSELHTVPLISRSLALLVIDKYKLFSYSGRDSTINSHLIERRAEKTNIFRLGEFTDPARAPSVPV